MPSRVDAKVHFNRVDANVQSRVDTKVNFESTTWVFLKRGV